MPKSKPREMKIYAHTKFLYMDAQSGLFIISPKWTQPKYPSTDYWVNKMEYVHVMEY